jgi:hypothetical protein
MSRRGFSSSGSGRRARTLSRFRPSHRDHIADNAGRSEKPTANINQLYLTAIDSEFKAMRAEIGRLIDHQRDLQNLSYISLAALLAFIGVLAKDARGLAIVLLFVPFLSLQFAFTAADISRRILQLGRYVDALAADVNTLLGRSGGQEAAVVVWRWERWKSRDFHDKKSAVEKKMVVVLEKSRWLSLAFPGILGIVAYSFLDSTPLGDDYEKSFFGLAIVVVLVSIFALTRYSSEAKGVVSQVGTADKTATPRSHRARWRRLLVMRSRKSTPTTRHQPDQHEETTPG